MSLLKPYFVPKLAFLNPQIDGACTQHSAGFFGRLRKAVPKLSFPVPSQLYDPLNEQQKDVDVERLGNIIRANDWWKGPPDNPLEVYWPFGNLRKTEMAVVVGDCILEINELLCLVALENHRRGLNVRVGSCSSFGNRLIRRQREAYRELYGSAPNEETDPDTLAWLIKNNYLSDDAGIVSVIANIDLIAAKAEMSVLEVLHKIQENCIANDSVAVVSVGSGTELPEILASLVHIAKLGNRAIQCKSGTTVSYIRDMRCGPYIGNTDRIVAKNPPTNKTLSLHSDIVAALWDELDPFLQHNMPFVYQRMNNPHIIRVASIAIVHCECSSLYPVIADNYVSFVAECRVWFDFSQNSYRPDEHAFISGLISGEARGSTVSIDSIHTLLANPIGTIIRR